MKRYENFKFKQFFLDFSKFSINMDLQRIFKIFKIKKSNLFASANMAASLFMCKHKQVARQDGATCCPISAYVVSLIVSY